HRKRISPTTRRPVTTWSGQGRVLSLNQTTQPSYWVVWLMVAPPSWRRAQARGLCHQNLLSGTVPLSCGSIEVKESGARKECLVRGARARLILLTIAPPRRCKNIARKREK